MTNLYNLIKKPENRRRKKGFEEMCKVTINKTAYILGIPFLIIRKEKGNSNTQILFQVESTVGIFPHFAALKGEEFAMTTAYENILEVKKVIEKDLQKLKPILVLKEKELKRNGFLVLSKNTLKSKAKLNLDLEDVKEIFSEKTIEKKRNKINVSSFKTQDISDLNSEIERLGIEVPEKVKTMRGLLSSILVEAINSLEGEKKKLTIKQKKDILDKYKKQLPNIFK